MKRFTLIFSLSCMIHCTGDTGQPFVTIDAQAVGTPARDEIIGEWTVRLTEAKAAFGPVTFCASQAASDELCARAQAELLSVTSLDLLSSQPVSLGKVQALVGTVRSAAYDWGIHWFPTMKQKQASEAAVAGAYSLLLRGEAKSNGRTVRFVSRIRLEPQYQGTKAVNATNIHAELTNQAQAFSVLIDPSLWLRDVNYERLANLPDAQSGKEIEIISSGETQSVYNAFVFAITSVNQPKFQWFSTK